MERNVRIRRRPVAATATPEAAADPSTPPSQAAVGAKSAFEVGYGKPPVHSRFKKGRSGNPRGRPKGAKNLQTLIERELGSKVIVNEGGQRREVTKRQAVVMRLVNAALGGSERALQILLKADAESARVVEVLARETAALTTDDHDDATDRAILESFRARLHAELEKENRCDDGNGTAEGSLDNDE